MYHSQSREMEKLERLAQNVRELTKDGRTLTAEEYDRTAAAILDAFDALESETKANCRKLAEAMATAGDRLNAARMEADALLLELATAAGKKERDSVDGINTIFWAYCATLNEQYTEAYRENPPGN